MDFPVFQLPFLGNRLLIAIVGITHVLISHGCAIGGSLLVVWLEPRFIKTGDRRLNDLAYRILRVLIILTTTLGALTGVGIWFTTAIVSPYGIGSLLRIFFWAWAIEWLIFIIELLLFLLYYLTWYRLEPHKHIKIGIAYIVFSYWTMIIIIGILGAMLTPGKWLINHRFWDGYLNATFLPQLASRTPMAVMLSCGFGLLISAFLFLYVYKFTWDTQGNRFWIHLSTGIAACLILFFIPFIFLTNINLMLYPDTWENVNGFWSAILLPNVIPRYLHFITASLAIAGFFSYFLFNYRGRRSSLSGNLNVSATPDVGFYIRASKLGILWALFATLSQTVFGLINFVTLPEEDISKIVNYIFNQ